MVQDLNNEFLNMKKGTIFQYNEIYGLLNRSQLTSAQYHQTWNSYMYNPTLGDPLQISQTTVAQFLNPDGD